VIITSAVSPLRHLFTRPIVALIGGDGEIDIELKDELSPGIIRKIGVESYLYVLMPMRL
jgi:hypothetical protein